LKTEAQRVGFIVACPKGRDSASMYPRFGEADVLDVMAEVRRDYKIDDAHYMMGHSMGGYGTGVSRWRTRIVRSAGPIAARQHGRYGEDSRLPHTSCMATTTRPSTFRIAHDGRSREEAARRSSRRDPGGSHTDVAAPQFGPC